MPLRVKIILILILTVIVSLSGSGLFFLHHFETAFRTSAFQTVDTIARTNAQSISDYLRMQQVAVHHIGSMLPRDVLLAGNYERLETFFEKWYKDFSIFENGFFFLDKNGLLRADYPPHPETRNKSYAFRPYFQKTMAEKADRIADPYRSNRTGKAVLTFTAYITTEDGEPLGMLGCSAQLLSDVDLGKVRTQEIGNTGYSYVFDKSRLLILHPDEKRTLVRDIPVGANKMFDAAISGFEGPGETVNSRGLPMLVAFHQVPGTDWIVAAQQPVAEALHSLDKSQRPLVLFIIVGSIVAAGTGTIMVHRSMRGLVTLENLTAQLAIPDESSTQIEASLQAETEKLAELTTHVEFGPLATTISELYSRLGLALVTARRMADELDTAYQQLKATQTQILQQEKMASIGQLAAGVAHEINNPMGFITSNLSSLGRYQEKLSSYLQLLEGWMAQQAGEEIQAQMTAERKKLKIDYVLEDIQELLAESADGAERVRDIVQNLKSFSRVDQLELSDVDLNECLENTLAIAWNELKYKACVEKDFAELPLLSCYPQQLNQVFLNILVNAAQAIDKSGVIRIRTWQEDGQVKVAISDNGSGIPEAIRNRIFEPFFTTKGVGQGTGLGMSISYDIIKKHQGNIKIESTEGQGTTFTIELPCEGKEGGHV